VVVVEVGVVSVPGKLAFDTEATDVAVFSPSHQVTHLSWAYRGGDGSVVAEARRITEVPAEVWKWLCNPGVLKVAHHWAHDYHEVSRYLFSGGRGPLGCHERPGIFDEGKMPLSPTLCYPMHDTMIMHHFLDETKSVSKGLKHLARVYCLELEPWELEVSAWVRRHVSWPPPEELLIPYASGDAKATLLLEEALWSRLGPRQQVLFKRWMAHLRTLSRVEEHGMELDLDRLEVIAGECELKMGDAERLVYGASAITNIRSNVQIYKWLQAQGVRLTKKTEGGQPAVGEDVLGRLITSTKGDVQAVVEAIQAYRKAEKTRGKILGAKQDPARGLLNAAVDSRLYPAYDLTGTPTGRLSASPSPQNLERAKGGVRTAFISRYN